MLTLVGGIVVALSGSAEVSSPSVHADHRARRLGPPTMHHRERTPPFARGAFTSWVYGYYAYWAGTLQDIAWDRLTHVAIFEVGLNPDGTLFDTHHWTDVIAEAKALAEPYGVKLHLVVTNFTTSELDTFLSNPAYRATAVEALGQLVDDHGGDGVSVDFENMGAGNIHHLVEFVSALKERVPEVTVATPPVDWAQAYHYPNLAATADALFIMGYNFHWSTGDPGPNAPLFGMPPWGQYALDWSVQDYLSTGVAPSKLVLGLPLYGYVWPTVDNAVPGVATGTATSVTFAQGVADAAIHGRLWDEPSTTPYYFPSATSQAWYDDTESLEQKIVWALEDQQLLGIGFWALNYEGGDPGFWAMVGEHTQEPGEEDTGGGETFSGDGTETFTGGGDAGGGTSGEGPSSGTTGNVPDDGTTGSSSSSGAPTDDDSGGCSCGSAPGPAPVGWLALAFVAAARRRHRVRTAAGPR